MRDGYVNTKIGILPKEWFVTKQIDVATFFNGRAYKLEEWEANGTPVIRLQNLTGTGKEYYYSNLKLPEHQYCQRGDLLYMWSATFGPVWWFGEKAIYHYHIWKIEHDTVRLSPAFHYYLLNDITTRMKNESHGSTMLHVTKGGMEKLLIQLPPLPEQQKIAKILSTVDEKINLIDKQIAETTQVKKGLMQRLLTKGIGHTEFKDSPLGEIPESWEVVKFNEVCYNNSIKYNETTGKCIELEHIEQQTSRLLGYSRIEEKSSIKNAFSIGDVLFCKLRPYLRKYWKCEFNGGCTSELMVLSPKSNFTTDFLFYTIQQDSFIENSVSKSYGTKMPRTSWRILSEYEMGLPSIKEQQKIASILSSVDEKLEVLSDKKNNYKELKKGLMQQLLTGKIRVNVN